MRELTSITDKITDRFPLFKLSLSVGIDPPTREQPYLSVGSRSAFMSDTYCDNQLERRLTFFFHDLSHVAVNNFSDVSTFFIEDLDMRDRPEFRGEELFSFLYVDSVCLRELRALVGERRLREYFYLPEQSQNEQVIRDTFADKLTDLEYQDLLMELQSEWTIDRLFFRLQDRHDMLEQELKKRSWLV